MPDSQHRATSGGPPRRESVFVVLGVALYVGGIALLGLGLLTSVVSHWFALPGLLMLVGGTALLRQVESASPGPGRSAGRSDADGH